MFEVIIRTTYAFIFAMVILSGAYFSFIHCNKPLIMYHNYLDNSSYKIFPWDTPSHQQTSKSSPIWLIVHIFDAYFHVLLTGIVYFTYASTKLFKISHYIFVSIILINLQHAGDFPTWDPRALLFNGTPLLIAMLTFDLENNIWWKSLIYLISISSAILFETGMYMMK